VYAAGDCAQIYDAWSGEQRVDSLWPTAISSGRTAAANMTGARMRYNKGVPFNAALLFDCISRLSDRWLLLTRWRGRRTIVYFA
jgi:NADPH-dependent 2,4-dienoyl-CoA reductase/sulfur reductase-like enzyme